jgi:hypothetical protein
MGQAGCVGASRAANSVCPTPPLGPARRRAAALASPPPGRSPAAGQSHAVLAQPLGPRPLPPSRAATACPSGCRTRPRRSVPCGRSGAIHAVRPRRPPRRHRTRLPRRAACWAWSCRRRASGHRRRADRHRDRVRCVDDSATVTSRWLSRPRATASPIRRVFPNTDSTTTSAFMRFLCRSSHGPLRATREAAAAARAEPPRDPAG